MRRILIVGEGYAGFYTAWHLERRMRRGEADVTLVDPRGYMTYQPFLPEVAAGSIEPRHTVVSLRRHLRRTTVVTAYVTSIDHADEGIGLKHVEEAVAVRDRLLTSFDRAACLPPGPARRSSSRRSSSGAASRASSSSGSCWRSRPTSCVGTPSSTRASRASTSWRRTTGSCRRCPSGRDGGWCATSSGGAGTFTSARPCGPRRVVTSSSPTAPQARPPSSPPRSSTSSHGRRATCSRPSRRRACPATSRSRSSGRAASPTTPTSRRRSPRRTSSRRPPSSGPSSTRRSSSSSCRRSPTPRPSTAWSASPRSRSSRWRRATWAAAVVAAVLHGPANTDVEVGGPERFRYDELLRAELADAGDPREVVTDPEARYWGAVVDDRSLVPEGDHVTLGATTLAAWKQAQAATGAAA